MRTDTWLTKSVVLVLFLLGVQVFVGCSTKKKAFANKAYHYTTARFNGYFHGREAYKEAKKALYKAHVDNYEQTLSVYRYGSKAQVESQYSALNRAIQKSTKMVEKHSMRFKSKGKLVESNKMIDDCYFLLGQSQFLKMQYDSAENTFKYLLAHFEHSPLFYEVELALIKTLIYQENYVDAETKFKAIEEDEFFDEQHRGKHDVLRALYYINTQDNVQAIEYLVKALPEVKKSRLRLRLKYILAQLYSAENQLKKASLLFEELAKKAVFYEMEFNAKLSLAKTHQGKDSDKIVSILNKMLKDNKNKDFQDQIYFTLAQVHEKNGDEEIAMKNYKLSAQKSVNNPKQKALSYLAVADYNFKIPEYVQAQMFYDSSMISLPKGYPDYELIKNRANNLTALVEQLNVVSREDSLQRIAAMPENERLALIDGLIQELEEEEEAVEIALQAKLLKIKADAVTQVNKGGWIFDNPVMLASANAEFIGLFGNRKLEDNWRRSDRSSVSLEELEDLSEEEGDELGNEELSEDKTVAYYTKNLPFSQAAVDSSNIKIERALHQTALIFNNKLNDQEKANFYFEELNRRFPKNDKRPQSLYQLYRNYDKAGDRENAAISKSLILSEFPSSEYALLIKYPNRGAEEEILAKQMNGHYDKMLALYQEGQYDAVLSYAESNLDTSKSVLLKPNFDMLTTFALGQERGKEAFENGLNKLVLDHQGTVQASEAKAILAKINFERMSKIKGADQKSELVFDTTLTGPHYFVFIYNYNLVDSTELKGRLSQINEMGYANLGLNIELNTWLGSDQFLLVQEFKSKGLAIKYADDVQVKVLDQIKNTGNRHFVISDVNYSKLLSAKDTKRYLKFYKNRY